MNLTTIALMNGALAVLMLITLALVTRLGHGIHRVHNAESIVPAAPTPLGLHDEQLSRAA